MLSQHLSGFWPESEQSSEKSAKPKAIEVIVHPIKDMLSSFTHPYVVPNL